ncbi:hypothetical protein GGX14DRAFT_588396 [Mycena pura]|uniref:NADH:flavin oxidoreductase/NADH oxidase N-terminal domain-containing protein n=1 Tax=Mycena pura TaxID=153505 RepID=A0AAD6Y483_9AGAR|nr:hypothetical protein GGX14DRAFT_588396 [Mycena pura]
MSPDCIDSVFSPIALPSGRILRNRLVKAALYEHLAELYGGPPNRLHLELYSTWASHDWGMIVTGNVQVSPSHLSLARDLVVPHELSEKTLKPFRALAAAMHGPGERGEGPLAIMQLSHAGRQSPNILGGRFPFAPPLGPSEIRVGASLKHQGILSALLHRMMFQIPQAMSVADIDEVVDAFVRGARVAARTGFDGVELHAAHGYLLAQFISPKSNIRTDEYSKDSLRLLHRIVVKIRRAVPPTFILGLKVNAADYSDASVAGHVSDALEHVRIIANWGLVDFVEISGGDYEKPDFISDSAPSARQALFSEFSQHAARAIGAMAIPRAPLVLLTGGLSTPAHLYAALSAKHAHLLGIGRSAVLCPNLPKLLHAQLEAADDTDPNAPFAPPPNLCIGSSDSVVESIVRRLPRIELVGGGVTMAWYVVMLRRLATSNLHTNSARTRSVSPRADYTVGGLGGVVWMWAWFGPELLTLRFTLIAAIPFFLVALALIFFAWDLQPAD